ncbi:MAG: hypothetical protein DCF22_05245 [Leptolyngbya sp.]|nr:MAG: hypothetical protein DCF22_05245 [Leptolyngbya sp.]
MGLFDQIMGAIANPNQQANPDQMSDILGAVQQIAGNNSLDAGTGETMVSMVGGYVRSALQQQQTEGGDSQVAAIVNQFGGIGSNPAAVSALFSADQQAQIATEISQRTGLPAGTIQGLLASLIPILLNLLGSGKTLEGNSNPLLNNFLDSNNDGNVDLGDAMRLASRFM